MTFGLSEAQLTSLRDSNAKINIWEGAVRSGKTYVSLWRFLKELTYGKSGDYCIICRTYDSFKRNLLPQLVKMIGGDVRYFSGKREMHIWGKTVHIIGADDERAETKVRGPTFQGAYVDELTIIPESVFKMLISRCAMGGARIFATTNPDSPFHWAKKEFIDNNPDVKSFQFTMMDNPELQPEERDYLRRQYKGLWYQRFVEGKWVQAEGAIYDMFSEKDHVIDFPLSHATQYIVGIDYGTANPFSAIKIGINPEKYPNVWVEDEYYYDSRAHQRQKTDSEYCDDLRRFLRVHSPSRIYIDPSAVSFKVEMQRAGFQNVLDGENEVIDGIRLVANFLDNGTLKICRGCPNLIREFQSYVWDSKAQLKGEDRPLKDHDHALDALRYAIYSHFFKKDVKSTKGEDLDRLWNEVSGGNQNLPRFFQ